MVAEGVGLKIINTDHKRDKSAVLAEMTAEVCRLLPDGEGLRRFIGAIRADKPRYLRNQLILLREVNSANDFEALISKFRQQSVPPIFAPTGLNPLKRSYPQQALLQPQMSRIDDYQQILNLLN